MDILAKYEKENPEQRHTPQNIYNEDQGENNGLITQWVIRIFKGRIQNVRQANMVLIGAAMIMIIIALIILFGLPGSSPTVPLLPSVHPNIIQ